MKVNLSLNKYVDLEIEGNYFPLDLKEKDGFSSSFIISTIKQTKGTLLDLISVVSEYSEFDKVLDSKILEKVEEGV